MAMLSKPPASGWIPAHLEVTLDAEGARVSLKKTGPRVAGILILAGVAAGVWYVGPPKDPGDGKTVGLLVALGIVGCFAALFSVFFAFTNTRLVARRFARRLELERMWLGIPYSTRHVDLSSIRDVSVSDSITFWDQADAMSVPAAIFAIVSLLFTPTIILSLFMKSGERAPTRAAAAIRIRLSEGGTIITHLTHSRRDCHDAVRAIRDAMPELAPEPAEA